MFKVKFDALSVSVCLKMYDGDFVVFMVAGLAFDKAN